MGQLVFQATLGGQVNLVGPNTASTFNLDVPAVNSTLSTTSGTETLTNKTLTTPVINGFTGSTAVVNIGSGQFYKDTAGNVGVGTTSPTDTQGFGRAFDLRGATGSAMYIRATNGGANDWGLVGQFAGSEMSIYNKANTPITFSTNGTERMRLDSSGNLGLGVTPSAWTSGVKAFDIGLGTAVVNPNSAATTWFLTNAYHNSNFIYKNNGFASSYRMVGAEHQWFTAPSGTAGNTISFTQAMTLDASGNLGIGTTSPGAKLDVTNGASPASRLRIGVGGGAAGTLYSTLAAGDYINFETNGSERARIDSSGNLQIGTTTQYNSARMTLSYAGSSNNGVSIIDTANTSNTQYISFQNSAGGQTGYISRVGTTNVVIYNTSSDYRLKNVIGAVSGAGERIDALEPIEYTWKADGSQSRGFLAHKFKEIYSQSVSGEKDAVDANGNPKYQAMQAGTSEVIADLVAEIQSLRQRVAQLESN